MPRRSGPLQGHTRCPECDSDQAEVRLDRSGHPYRICRQCSPATVYFTRGARLKVERLIARTRLLPESARERAARRASRPDGIGGTGALALQLAMLHRS
jgi:hypothetical protein